MSTPTSTLTSFTKIAAGVGCGILFAIGASMVTCTSCVAINMKTTSVSENAALDNISFEDVKGKKGKNYVTISGKVRNNGTTAIPYVKVGIELLDSQGNILDTDWTYAVSIEPLQPGAAKSFDLMTPTDSRMKDFRYYVITK